MQKQYVIHRALQLAMPFTTISLVLGFLLTPYVCLRPLVGVTLMVMVLIGAFFAALSQMGAPANYLKKPLVFIALGWVILVLIFGFTSRGITGYTCTTEWYLVLRGLFS